jgi:hypothetical protein
MLTAPGDKGAIQILETTEGSLCREVVLHSRSFKEAARRRKYLLLGKANLGRGLGIRPLVITPVYGKALSPQHPEISSKASASRVVLKWFQGTMH